MADLSEAVLEAGFERDRVRVRAAGIRWWLYLFVPGARLRNQRARRGVVDRGFHFARGGRASSDGEARRLLDEAYRQARREADSWRGQPSHALGRAGELVPLDEVIPELTA